MLMAFSCGEKHSGGRKLKVCRLHPLVAWPSDFGTRQCSRRGAVGATVGHRSQSHSIAKNGQETTANCPGIPKGTLGVPFHIKWIVRILEVDCLKGQFEFGKEVSYGIPKLSNP